MKNKEIQKTNREIFSHALSSKKRYLTNELTEMVKNDIVLYTKYLWLPHVL